MMLDIIVPGNPVGKARPRFNGAVVYTPSITRDYEQLVAITYRRKYGTLKFDKPKALHMTIKAYFGIPKKDVRKTRNDKLLGKVRPTKKPDWDNIGKVIADALNGVAYDDDSQIVSADVIKLYSIEPRVEVMIFEEKYEEG